MPSPSHQSPSPSLRIGRVAMWLGVAVGVAWFGILHGKETQQDAPQTYRIAAGPGAQFRLQERLIDAIPGDVIVLEAARYELRRQLNVVADNVTIRGQGAERTVLAFRDQISGAAGLEATGNNLTLEGFAVEDTAGNAIKVLGANGVTFRDVRAEWTGEATSANGAYGLYPVQCENVLVEGCTAIGASDAGIYVGQCKQVVVRDSRAEKNVAGIEIENTIGADVYGNVATNNAGGILVFDLPGLQIKAGRVVRVYKNRVFANNHANFAAPGNAVASIPPGTGVMVMATDQVEVFDNDIEDNQTANVSIVDYRVTGKKMKESSFDPIPESVSVHDNRFSGGGNQPGGELGLTLRPVLGGTFPDVLVLAIGPAVPKQDGDPEPGPTARSLRIADNGDIAFAYVDLETVTPQNVLLGKVATTRDAGRFSAPLAPLPETRTSPHAPPKSGGNPAVSVYRSVPKRLSEYGLFEGDGSTQQPAAGVERYELNTALFSDYALKHRFIRIPDGTSIEFRDEGVFDFPIGTVIAKTFAYPIDMRNLELGQRLVETRIELLNETGWYGFSYLWNDEQTDATLVLGGSEVDVSWIHDDGQRQEITYEVPNANQCLSCHSEQKEYVPIGPTALNLNRSRHDDSENQLAHLARVGWLKGHPAIDEAALDEIGRMPQFDDPTSGTVAARARAWLDVNCAHCHNPSGTARTTGMDLRMTQSDRGKIGVWKVPVAAGHGSGGREYDIVPGKPEDSILLFRLESTDPSIAMPNVSRQLVPAEAVTLIHDWIAEMQPE